MSFSFASRRNYIRTVNRRRPSRPRFKCALVLITPPYYCREWKSDEFVGSLQGTRASLRNLNSKITRLDEDALKQQEVLYNQDFTIQQLERRIGRMQVLSAIR